MNPITNHVGTSAPAKIILFGEHFVVYNKPAILASIDKRVHVDVSVRNDNKIVIKSNMGFGGSFDEKNVNSYKPSHSNHWYNQYS